MQTLRKKSSPCKYKYDPSRFLGEGIIFKAKLIGILEVNEARGDKMCQDALNDLKTAIRAAGEHKQRITISVAIDGLKLRDEKTGECMYQHPVHKISFIAQDMSDSRAFGYIFGSPDTGHRFFGIKTEKAASQVVITMRDLFQVVFELKKKEIEYAKYHHIMKYGLPGDTNPPGNTNKEDVETLKVKPETHETAQGSSETSQKNTNAIADLLDLEDELNNIQQGINQMDRITPSDPFGPLGKDSFLDDKPGCSGFNVTTASSNGNNRTGSSSSAIEPDSGIFSATSNSKKGQFFPTTPLVSAEEPKYWFDKETESIFNENTTTVELTSPPTNTQQTTAVYKQEKVQDDDKILKADVFTDLDPLGTGKVKPYLDKKDFFQELKNPPKKVLKEIQSDPTKGEEQHYFETNFGESADKGTRRTSGCGNIEITMKEASKLCIDPFEDADPFEKADPFLESTFTSTSIGFSASTSLTTTTTQQLPLSNETIVDKTENRHKVKSSLSEEISVTTSLSQSLFTNSLKGAFRVSLPPEKTDSCNPITLSSITSRFCTSPSPTEESRTLRRRHYQSLKQSLDLDNSSHKKLTRNASPQMERRSLSSQADTTPTPPPKPKSPLIAIKPPPLPPKKIQKSTTKTPSPVFVATTTPYYESRNSPQDGYHHLASPKKHKRDDSAATKGDKVRRHHSDLGPKTQFPLLPPPPTRKAHSATSKPTSPLQTAASDDQVKDDHSVLNITLNQLDQSGLKNLADTLGITMENVSNMTLQELTKRLAQKYLDPAPSDKSNGTREESSFKADFETMFKNGSFVDESYHFDKYAALKELRAEDSVTVEPGQEGNAAATAADASETPSADDKYAALRHLSLSTQKSENLSEDLDVSNEEDSSARADISEIMKQHTDESFTPLHSAEMISESPNVKFADWNQLAASEDVEEVAAAAAATATATVLKKPHDDDHHHHKIGEADNGEKLTTTTSPAPANKQQAQYDKENWAKFEEKLNVSVINDPTTKEKTRDEENSPLTSDGKDEPQTYSWHNDELKTYDDDDIPWHDEDDDYSPKDAPLSDESSFEGNLPPVCKTGHRRIRKCRKHSKDYHYKWVERSEPMPSNKKWLEDTEDEYEEMHRRRGRQRPSSFDRDRRRDYYERTFDRYERHAESRYDKPPPHYRFSEDRDEYYRKCESDGSERDYNSYSYPAEKIRALYSAREPFSRDDIRDKFSRRTIGSRRPTTAAATTSALESRRMYDKSYSERCRESIKIESDDDEFGKRHYYGRKDANVKQYAEDYQKRSYTLNNKRPSRFSKAQNSEEGQRHESVSQQSSAEIHEKRYFLPPDTPNEDAFRKHAAAEKSFEGFEDDFTPSPVERSSLSSRHVDSPIEVKPNKFDWNRATSVNDDAFSPTDNTAEHQYTSLKDAHHRKTSVSSTRNRGNNTHRLDPPTSIRKSESINIFSRENDPFEDDEFFSGSGGKVNSSLGKFSEKSKSNTNVSADPFTWTEVFGD